MVFKSQSKSGTIALAEALERKHSDLALVKECALLSLRESIWSLENSRIVAKTITIEDITSGEVSMPLNLKSFYSNLYTGHDLDDNISEQKRRFVEVSSADAVFACSNGKMVTGKQLSLGLSLKSMTGSKKVVTLLNLYGHCVSNEMVRRVDIIIGDRLYAQGYAQGYVQVGKSLYRNQLG